MIPHHFLAETGDEDRTAAVFGSAKAAAAYVDFLEAHGSRLSSKYTWEHVVRIRKLRIDHVKIEVFIVVSTRKEKS